MDLIAEYAEMKSLPPHIAVTYKFFSLFRVEKDSISWVSHSAALKEEYYAPLKAFLKAMRADLRREEGILSANECSRRMWFWYQKILELELFSEAARLEIMRWMEICELVVC